MPDVKIRIYKGDDQHIASTVTIPGGIFAVAAKLMPARALSALKEQGIDLPEVVALASNPDTRGTIVDVIDHEKNEHVVVSVE